MVSPSARNRHLIHDAAEHVRVLVLGALREKRHVARGP